MGHLPAPYGFLGTAAWAAFLGAGSKRMGFLDRVKAMFGNVDMTAAEPEGETEPDAAPAPIVVVAGPAAGPSASGFTDYYCRETGAHVQAVPRVGKFTIYTQDGEQHGQPGDYWVRPSAGGPRAVAREVFEARFRPHGGE
jgi:hypothetical protein